MTAAAARRAKAVSPPIAAGAVAAGLGVAVGVALAVDLRIGTALALAVLAVPVALIDPPLIIAVWAGLSVVSRYPGVGLAMTPIGLLAAGAWLVHARVERDRIRSSLRPHRTLLVILALLLGWLTLSLAWASDPARAAAELAYWYINGAAVVILLTALRTPRDVNLVIAAVIIAVAASVALGLAGMDLGTAASAADTATSSEGRLQGASGDPNFMAAFIVAAVALAAVLWGVATSRWRVVVPALLGVLLVGLPATESRGGMLAFLVVLAVALAVMRGRRSAVLGGAALAVLVAGIWIAANPSALDRIQSAEQDRGNGREDLWLVAGRMSADHPLTGVGLHNFTLRSPEYVRRPGSMSYVDLVVDRPHEVHNTYLQILAETGAIGLGLFLAFAGAALASAVRAARRFERAGRYRLALLARGVLVADLGLLTAAFFISAQSTATLWILLALGPVLLGLACTPGTAIGHSSGSPLPAGTPPGGG